MRTQASRDGGLVIDHRASPGIDEDTARDLGIPSVPEGTLLELKTKTCSHCGSAVLLNPDRTRVRGHCNRCDHYLCDLCATAYQATGKCTPFIAKADWLVGGERSVATMSFIAQPSLVLLKGT